LVAFCGENKNNVSACFFLKSLTTSENHPSKPLQEESFGFQVVACDSRRCSENRLCFENCSKKAGYDMYSVVHWRKSTNDIEEKPDQKF
jgi:hypothetical protein